MKTYFEKDEWNIIENSFNMDNNRLSESIMSIGNGYMGMRGNLEEDFTGDSLRGTYVAGIYYPDKTRVGWWKNGYPEYFAKVLNSMNFIGIGVIIDGETLDLARNNIKSYKRVLNMKQGILLRNFTIIDSKGREIEIEVKRFLSLAKKEIAAISYSIKPLSHEAEVTVIPYIDGDVSNEDSNYDEKFWTLIGKAAEEYKASIAMKTKKLDFHVTAAMEYDLKSSQGACDAEVEVVVKDKYVANIASFKVKCGEAVTVNKYIAVTNTRYLDNSLLLCEAQRLVHEAHSTGFDKLFEEHSRAMEEHWRESDIVIEGDVAAQQAIRFNIFQLNQTYTGDDPRLNIGPKGFTGEKYGGSTYWDTEAYCIPFYLSTHEQNIARNLLVYRYNHLEKAKENARRLGVSGAFYPMVTMNGEECHNEWEITFEEIHRNAAISYAIYNYVNYTGDFDYIPEYGYEVLVETSRYWASRAHYNKSKDKYMIHGVTGPNEYENNVNNNWYTNTMAVWNLRYTLEVSEKLMKEYSDRYRELCDKLGLSEEEKGLWRNIISKMYFPYVKELGIFEQQDGYMDKEQKLVKELPREELPLNQNWSWDRILRSCFIKQADVLQGLYFLGDQYDLDVKKRNFDFYEPRTVHESSLSPCIHSIIAAEVGYYDKAYELYLRTARLDLDNYNNDTEDGLHITSMAGTWMSITYGFGGMRIRNNELVLNPFLPTAWRKYSFKVMFRGHLVKVTVSDEGIVIKQESGEEFEVLVHNRKYRIPENGEAKVREV